MIRRKEQDRIERIRDENHQLKEMTPEKKIVSVLSPLKSPVSVRLILTPRKTGMKTATEGAVVSSSHQAMTSVSTDNVKGVRTPVKRNRADDMMEEVPRKKADRTGKSVPVAASGLNGEGEVASVKGVVTPVKAEVASPVKGEVSSPLRVEVSSPVKVEDASVQAKPSSPVKIEVASVKTEATSPVKTEATSPVKAEATSPVKAESVPVQAKPSSPVKVEPTSLMKTEATSPVKAESVPVQAKPSSPVKMELTSPVKAELPSTSQSSIPTVIQSSSAKETNHYRNTPFMPQSETIPTPSQSLLEHTTPSKLPSKKPKISISTTPLHGLPVPPMSSFTVKDTESNGSRGSGNESIQAKTQLLLQRVEGMKKRKEERLQHSVLMTPGKPLDPIKMRPKLPSRGLASLSARKGGITLDEDLSMPALPAVVDTMERSFISIVSSPAAQRKHAPSVSQDTAKKQKEELPPKRTIPIGARRVPVQKTPLDAAKPSSVISKSSLDQPKPQLDQPKPQLDQHHTANTHPEAPPSIEPSKKRPLPTQNKMDPEPKRPAAEPPKLPSNRSRAGSNATSTLPEFTPNLEVLRQLVDSEKIDPAKRWYEEGNIDILLRRQYYESFTNVRIITATHQ